MSFVRSKSKRDVKDASNNFLANVEQSRARDLAGPVETRQGGTSEIKLMWETITCRNCWQPLEKGSPFRYRRDIGKFRAHVSCSRTTRLKPLPRPV